jgi:hypothetical protein
MNHLREIAQSIVDNDYSKFIKILNSNNFTSQELGHLFVCIIPKATLEDNLKYKNSLIEKGADFLISSEYCGCTFCRKFNEGY